MRLLAIGYALPHSSIDNYNALTAPSYFDYDALFIDPASITAVAREVVEGTANYEAFDGRPVLNAATSAGAVSAADQLRRRAEETRRLLERGGTVLVMTRPQAAEGGLLGFEGCDRYSWLPAPEGMGWGPPFLLAAEGQAVRILAEDHALAAFLRAFRSQLGYRATFDDSRPELRRAGRALAAGGAGGPIAMEFSILGGRVVFLPALGDPVGPIRSEMAEALVDLVSSLQASLPGEEQPYWARSLALPGLEQLEAELEEAESAAQTAAAHAQGVRERHDALDRHRRLLWATGPAFAEAATGALRLLGFELTDGEAGLALSEDGRRALVELESGRGQVLEWPYVRLQRRLEERLIRHGEQLGGVIIANGQRDLAPDAREEALATTLVVACENYRYALVSGATLFALVQRALAGADEAFLAGVRRRIMGAAGELSTAEALGEAGERKDTGPIF